MVLIATPTHLTTHLLSSDSDLQHLSRPFTNGSLLIMPFKKWMYDRDSTEAVAVKNKNACP